MNYTCYEEETRKHRCTKTDCGAFPSFQRESPYIVNGVLAVVIQGLRGVPALDTDTYVFVDGKVLIGQIFETFGPVPAPLYSVRFNKVRVTPPTGRIQMCNKLACREFWNEVASDAVLIFSVTRAFAKTCRSCLIVASDWQAEDISRLGVAPGRDVFCVPLSEQLTRYVFTEQLRRLKGSDASWEHNNEPPSKVRRSDHSLSSTCQMPGRRSAPCTFSVL